jgi:CRP/FNR family transcriptional regulator, nitrogen oxide reductase regulator
MVVSKTTNLRLREHLKKVELFEGLSDAQIEQIIHSGVEQIIQAESFLFFQGDPAEKLYLIIEGKIKLTQITPEGQQVILRYTGPGDAIAIIALLSGIDYPVTAESTEESMVIAWDKERLDQFMELYPRISNNALKILANQTREFQDRIRELSTEKVERRIARALLRLVRQIGKKSREGVVLDMNLSRQDVAEMTGSSLFTVSRTLSKWEDLGLIRTAREQVTILFPHGLVEIAEDLPPSKNASMSDQE